MSIDYGLVIVIIAVLIFYLRLIILQRQRAKQLRLQRQQRASRQGKAEPPESSTGFSVVSARPLDRVIGAAGLILVVFGLLLYSGFFPLPELRSYWWIPTALGIVGFSWLFRL